MVKLASVTFIHAERCVSSVRGKRACEYLHRNSPLILLQGRPSLLSLAPPFPLWTSINPRYLSSLYFYWLYYYHCHVVSASAFVLLLLVRPHCGFPFLLLCAFPSFSNLIWCFEGASHEREVCNAMMDE